MREFDPYKFLGISPEADLSEIKRAFREKVREAHPDLGGEKEYFLKLKQCYEELCRVHARKARLRPVQERPRSGEYLLSFLELSVKEAALGAEIVARVPDKPIKCPRCQGRGVDLAGRREICPVCKGEGMLVLRSGEDEVSYHTCLRCGGAGELFVDLCPSCRGRGELPSEKEMRLVVPAGVRNGDILHLPTGPGGPSIDVFFEVHVLSRGVFSFEEERVITTVRVPFWKAILGGKVVVETLEGPEEMELPKALQPGMQICLPNRGGFREDGTRGDLVVRFEVYFPSEMPLEARILLEKLAQILGEEEYYECVGQA